MTGTRAFAIELVLALALCAAAPRRAAAGRGGDGDEGAQAWTGRAELARALELAGSALRDVASLRSIDPAFDPGAQRLDARSGVAADFQRWTQYRIAYEKSLEQGFGYGRLELLRAGTRSPLAAPLEAADRAQALLASPGPTALLDGLLALDDLVPGAPAAPPSSGSALERFEAAVEQAALLARQMTAAAADEREALGFLARWLCRTGETYAPRSDEAPAYELGWRLARTDPFAPGSTATLTGLAIPPSVPSMASAYHLFRALGDEPWRTAGWAPFDRGPEVVHRGFEGVRLDFAAGARAARSILAYWEGSAHGLAAELEAMSPRPATLPGVTGDVLFERETAHGGIVVGGPGPNHYGAGSPAAILDLGGDDVYDDARGLDGALAFPLSVIADLGGDDLYRASGVAGPGGGVFGVALLLDVAGNDRYVQGLAPGREQLTLEPTGGPAGPWRVDPAPLFGGQDAPTLDGGFAFGAALLGFGMLVDAAGDDVYLADKWCFGAALGRGVGLCFDGGGKDAHVAGALSLGVGVNKGLGALVARGSENDVYQVWGVYRFLDAAQEGDGGFLSFGLGTGASWRVETRAPEPEAQPTQGGGIGLFLEEGGDDLVAGACCSQGSGYGGGLGVLLDLAGNDRRAVLRADGSGRAPPNDLAGIHAMGDAGHLGLGLLLDVAGDDRYVGALQGGGYGWDAGAGFLVDLAGSDRYGAEEGGVFAAGSAGAQGLGLFFDAGGADVLEASCARLGDASEHRPDYRIPGGPFALTILGGGTPRALGGEPLAPGTVRLGPVAELKNPRGAALAGFGALLVPAQE